MSPDSQRLEVDMAHARALYWFGQQEDMDRLVESTIAFWLQPALDELDLDESAMAVKLGNVPGAYPTHMLMMEEAFGMPGERQSCEGFMQGPGARESGLRRRYLRRLAASSPRFLQVTDVRAGQSFDVAPLGGGSGWTIHDREMSHEVNVDEALIARLIDMPAGAVLGEGLIRVRGLVGKGIPDSDFAVSRILSDVVIEQLDTRRRASSGVGARPPEGVAPDRKPPDPLRPTPSRAADTEPDVAGRADSSSPRETPPVGGEREKLLERVRKLFAMAQESEASPHEAEIALRRCQSLMNKYGITEADLETSAFATVGFGRRSTIPTHLRVLAAAVAKMHDCLFVTGNQGHTEFRGYEVDAHVARLTLDYLLDAVERALRARKRNGDFPPGRSAAYDYRLGFASEVQQRVATLVSERRRQQQAASGGSGTDLALRKLEIVERECGQGLGTRSFGSRAPQDATAHGAGRADGASVSLDKQVGGATARPSLPR